MYTWCAHTYINDVYMCTWHVHTHMIHTCTHTVLYLHLNAIIHMYSIYTWMLSFICTCIHKHTHTIHDFCINALNTTHTHTRTRIYRGGYHPLKAPSHFPVGRSSCCKCRYSGWPRLSASLLGMMCVCVCVSARVHMYVCMYVCMNYEGLCARAKMQACKLFSTPNTHNCTRI